MTTPDAERLVASLNKQYEEFLTSADTLRVYQGAKLIFHSRKARLVPLMDYIDGFVPATQGVTVFDRVTGNAAALLLKVASCAQVLSPLGSDLAARTLESCGIVYQFGAKVPHITDGKGEDMCPMEKLSLDKTPEEFHVVMRHMAHITKRDRSKN